ncbi:MAG: FKBP-type peptidyl-prolyl cis-trans isomerase [Balneolaceae bacterium]|nr:FKBP-type peptidyl-prolyl cis-trans isomerase [Balneolaceae bacterium]
MQRLSLPYHQAIVLMLAILVPFISGCGDNASGPDFSTVPSPYDTSQAVKTVTTPGGMVVHIIEEGDGAFQVVSRDIIDLFYTGRSLDDQRVFDSSYANGSEEPRTFRNLTPVSVASGNQPISPLIEGFRKGITGVTVDGETLLEGMREGERRTLIIPPSMGYAGAPEGNSGYNLRNDTLRFDIKLSQIYY